MRAFFNQMAVGSIRKQMVGGVFRKTKAKRHSQPVHPYFTQGESKHDHLAHVPESLKRRSISETVRIFTRQIVPKLETSLELRLLDRYKQRIPSEIEKQQLQLAYLERKRKVEEMKQELFEAPMEEDLNQIKIPEEAYDNLYSSQDGIGLKYHTYKDIGKYTVFPAPIFETVFPGGHVFGEYATEFCYTQKYGIMCREEGLKLAYDFSWVKTKKERENKVDYMGLLNSGIPLNDIAKDEDVYLFLYQEICDIINDYIKKKGVADHLTEQILSNAAIFNGIVGVLLRNMKARPLGYHLLHPKTREGVVKQTVAIIVSKLKQINQRPKDFIELVGYIGNIQLKLDNRNLQGLDEIQEQIREAKKKKVEKDAPEESDQEENKYGLLEDLYSFKVRKERETYEDQINISYFELKMRQSQQFNQTHWRPPALRRSQIDSFKGFNTGALLWGDAGIGKSQILTYLTMWAHECDWIVLAIPHAREFVRGEPVMMHRDGLYLQNETTRKLLMRFRNANYQQLRNFEVDLSLYGNCDMAGVHQEGRIGSPRRYLYQRRTTSDAWKKFINQEDKIQDDYIFEFQEDKWIGKKLQKPETLLDIVNAGIKDMYYSTSALAEILIQLYHTQQYKTMILIDQYNHWFKPSSFHSYRYMDVPRERRGFIPPFDLAVPRLLMNFDGQFMRNGVKVCATSIGSWFKHVVTPGMINFPPKGFDVKVGGLALDDFRNGVYYHMMNGYTYGAMEEPMIQAMFQDSQGNWKEMMRNSQEYNSVF